MKKLTRFLNYFKQNDTEDSSATPELKISKNDASFGANEKVKEEQAEDLFFDEKVPPIGKDKNELGERSGVTTLRSDTVKKSQTNYKYKKNAVKKENMPTKNKPKKEKITEEPEVAANGQEEKTSVVSEKKSEPARKRPSKQVEESEDKPPAKKRNTSKESVNKADNSPKQPVVVVDSSNHNLPNGWIRKRVVRKSGKSAGQVDVYIYSPDGVKFRSKPDVASYLLKTKSNLKIDLFDFSTKAAQSDAPGTSPKRKELVSKAKLPSPKKKPVTPKKTSKLLVKIEYRKGEKKVPVKRSQEKKVSKATAKGKKASKAKKG